MTLRVLFEGGRLFKLCAILCTLFMLQSALGLAKEPKLHPTRFGQAPSLESLVEEGKLPPVDDRIPKIPAVVRPAQRLGEYGGTWHMITAGNRDHALLLRSIGYENLVRWNPQWTRVIPNVAHSYKTNADYTEYRFILRKGLRWSDGAPFTADDILFWYEDVLLNPELSPNPPTWMVNGGKPAVVEKIDQYQVVFRFTEPNGFFLFNLARPEGAEPTCYPKHYLKQFLPKYNEKLTVEDLQWKEEFINHFGQPGNIDDPSRWNNPDLPVLFAWRLKNGYNEGREDIHAERNPYYWKIDPKGRQLPYIDSVVFYSGGANQQKIDKMAAQGMVDMQNRHFNEQGDKEFLQENMEKGGYRFFHTIPSRSCTSNICLNLTHFNPELQTLFRDKQFRIALSYAVDRPRIISELYQGEGVPYQNAPRPESMFFNKPMAYQYTEYDPEKAARILDEAGYDIKDDQGFRLNSKGERFSFVVEFTSFHLPMMKIIQENWRDIGVEIILVIQSRDKEYERKAQNLHDALCQGGEGGLDVYLENQFYLPVSHESVYAMGWVYWFRNPSHPLAQVPPKDVRDQLDLYRELTATGDQSQQAEIMKQILQIASEQFYTIGIALQNEGFGLIKENFHNVPDLMPYAWSYPTPAPTNPCQYFIEQPE